MMSKTVSLLVAGITGAAAASFFSAMRQQKLDAKAFQKEAIQRWEDDGGNIPDVRSVKPAGGTDLRL